MQDRLTISITNWTRARDHAEKERYPMLKSDLDPSMPLFALPEMSIAAVDCEKYELLHVKRFPFHDGHTSDLESGYYYSAAPWAFDAEFVNIIQWGSRAEDFVHPDSEECKACRMSCGCGCGHRHNIEEHHVDDAPKQTIIHVSKEDLIAYAYHEDGTRTVTITYNREGDD